MRQGLESTRDSATSNSNFVPLCVDSHWPYQKYRLETGFPVIESIAMTGDGKLLVTGHHQGDIGLWQLHSGKCLGHIKAHDGIIRGLAINVSNTLLASCANDSLIKLWELNSLTEITELSGHLDEVNDVVFHPDDNILFSCSADKTIKVWELS